MKNEVIPGSVWECRNGGIYAVTSVADPHATRRDEYPATVVYVGADGRVWSRPLSKWHRSMTEVMED